MIYSTVVNSVNRWPINDNPLHIKKFWDFRSFYRKDEKNPSGLRRYVILSPNHPIETRCSCVPGQYLEIHKNDRDSSRGTDLSLLQLKLKKKRESFFFRIRESGDVSVNKTDLSDFL